MNLFTFVFSNLALILFSFTVIILAFIAFFWSLTNSSQKKSRAFNINSYLVKLGAMIFEDAPLDTISTQAIDLIQYISGHSSISLHEWNTQKEKFITLASKSTSREVNSNFFMTIKLDTLHCATSAAPEFPVFEIDNIPDYFSIEDPAEKGKYLILIPLKSKGRLIGSVALHDVNDPALISKEDQKILVLVSTMLGSHFLSSRLQHDFDNATIFDDITGQYKYSYFRRYLEQEIERADRYESSATLMSIDISTPENMFVEPDDSFYRKSSDTITSALRSIDLLFMDPSNNSFIVILSQTNNSTALDVANRVIQKFTKTSETQLQISIGLSTYPIDATLEDTIVDNVQACLDQARTADESKIVNYSDLY